MNQWIKVAMTSLVLLLLLTMAINANASAPVAWYRNVHINYVYSGKVGSRVAISVTPGIDQGTCLGSELTLDQDSPYFMTMFTIILLSYKAGSTIGVYTDGSCSGYGVSLTDVVIP